MGQGALDGAPLAPGAPAACCGCVPWARWPGPPVLLLLPPPLRLLRRFEDLALDELPPLSRRQPAAAEGQEPQPWWRR